MSDADLETVVPLPSHVTTTPSKEEVQRIFDLAIERMNYLGTGTKLSSIEIKKILL